MLWVKRNKISFVIIFSISHSACTFLDGKRAREQGKASCRTNRNFLGVPKSQKGSSLVYGPRQPMQAWQIEKTAFDLQL